MDINNLERANEILLQIKKLDAEIIEIDRLALLAADGEIKSSFKMSICDIGNVKAESEKAKFDDDGSLISNGTSGSKYTSIFESITFLANNLRQAQATHAAAVKNTGTLEQELSNSSTLLLLGVLLGDKQSRRRYLIKELKTYGINL